MHLWLVACWYRLAERIVGWTLGNNPERDRDHVLARIDTITAQRRHPKGNL